MTARQLSVFIENRQGRLGEVLSVIKASGVNILSMSVADTSEYGLLRLIVNKPEIARDALIAEGYSSMLTEILIIKLPHRTGALQEVLELVASKDVNIEYMYGLSVDGADASVVMKTNDLDVAVALFKENAIETMTEAEIAAL